MVNENFGPNRQVDVILGAPALKVKLLTQQCYNPRSWGGQFNFSGVGLLSVLVFGKVFISPPLVEAIFGIPHIVHRPI